MAAKQDAAIVFDRQTAQLSDELPDLHPIVLIAGQSVGVDHQRLRLDLADGLVKAVIQRRRFGPANDMSDPVRALIVKQLDLKGLSMKEVSLRIGRNHAFCNNS